MARTRQPQIPVRLSNTALAQSFVGLWHFASNDVNDIARSNNLTANGAVVPRALVNGEIGAVAPNANAHWRNSSPSDALKVSGSFSVVWRGVIYSDGVTYGYPYLCGMHHNTTDSAPYVCYSINRTPGPDYTGLAVSWNNAGTVDVFSLPSGTITYGELTTLVATFATGAVTLYKNGVYVGSKAPAGMAPDYGANSFLSIGGHSNSTVQNIDANTIFAGVANRVFSEAEARAIHFAPWQLFAPQRRLWIQLGAAAGGSGVTGASSGALASDTGTANATLAIAATSAATVNAATGTAVGDAGVTGVASGALAGVTGTATGATDIAGTASATVGAVTGAATATLSVVGTSAQSLAAVTGTANGTVVSGAVGASDATVGAVTGAAAGALALAAISVATVGMVSGTGAGIVVIVAASAQTLSDVTGNALGNTTGASNGTSAATLDSVTGTAAGHVDVLAVAAGTLADLTGTAAAQIVVTGASAGQLGGVTGPAAQTITSIDPRYLVPARVRRFVAAARGRRFIATT